MSVSYQHDCVALHACATAESSPRPAHGDPLHDTVLRDVMAVGQRGAEPAATTRAVMTCWQWLAARPVVARQALQDELRGVIARGRAGTRAWLPLALAETDAALLRAAVAGYLGSAPRSAAQRGQALDDVIEWFRRDLTLDRVAVFLALLALRDPEITARLSSLRGRLTDVERERALCELADAADPLTREFMAEWQGGPAVAEPQPD